MKYTKYTKPVNFPLIQTKTKTKKWLKTGTETKLKNIKSNFLVSVLSNCVVSPDQLQYCSSSLVIAVSMLNLVNLISCYLVTDAL